MLGRARERRAARGAASFPWARPRRELLLLALVTAAALVPLQAPNPQDESRVCLAEALLHGDVAASGCLRGVADYARFDGRLYSDKAPGLSLIELPAVALLQPGFPRGWPSRDYTLWVVRALSVGVAFCLLLFCLGRVGEGLAPGYGGAVIVGVGLGTLVAPLASVSFEHVPAALLAFAAFLLAWRGRPALAGLAAGAAVLVEYETGIVLAAVGLYVVLAGLRPLLAYLAGLLPGALLLGGYDRAAFGSPWHLSYRYVANEFAGEQATGFFGIGVPHLAGVVAVLAGDGGLLFASPLLLLAAVGLVRLARRWRAEAVLAATVAIALVLADCGYFLPYGGVSPGPRFLTAALPFLALGLGPAWAWRPRLTLALTALSALTTTAIALVWAGPNTMRQTVWGELARLPFGSSRLPSSLPVNVLAALGLGRAGGAVLVVLCAVAALVVAVRGLPPDALPRIGCSLPRRPPPRALLAAASLLALLLAADASAIFAYPYGDGYEAQISPLATSITASPPASAPGGEVNFVVTTANASQSVAARVLLTIDLGAGMRLVGPPAYTRGSGCSGSRTVVCDLDYLQSGQSTAVRFGVEITQPSYQTLSAHASSGGVPGFRDSSYTVIVGA